jgi:hypothetical protein
VQVSVDSIPLRELWHRIRDGRTRSFPERTGLGMLMTDRSRDPEYLGWMPSYFTDIVSDHDWNGKATTVMTTPFSS